MEWIRQPKATVLTVYLLLTDKLHSNNDSTGQGSILLNLQNGRLHVLFLWIYTQPQKENLVQGIAVESTVMNALVNLYAYNVYGVQICAGRSIVSRYGYTVMCCLTTGICYEKCVVK
jgi:hypothetical protein